MRKFVINEYEIDALDGLPPFDFKLYCILRSHMDYSTGVVGKKRRISYRMIGEWMYIEQTPGRHTAGAPTREQVRQSINRLMKSGLLQPTDISLVFRMPLATQDQCVQKSSNRGATGEQHGSNTPAATRKIQQKTDTCMKSAESSNRGATQEQHGSSNTPPVSGIRNINPPSGGIYIVHSTERNGRKSADRFDEFWDVYPTKVARKKCLDKWRAKGLDTIADRLIADVQRRCLEHRPWLEGYIPNPLTYLNQERWDDHIQPVRKKAGAGTRQTPNAIEDFLYGRQVGQSKGGNVIDGTAKTINPSEDDDDHHCRMQTQIR